MWGATIIAPVLNKLDGFQSAHPYVGCDAWQNTDLQKPKAYFNPRTPMWGATCICSKRLCQHRDFNPRTPMWGATFQNMIHAKLDRFQSAHPYVGCDISRSYVGLILHIFQSAHPYVGCDPFRLPLIFASASFQSAHPYVGCDHEGLASGVSMDYFNPRTPMWGATLNARIVRSSMVTFQSAHPYVGCDILYGHGKGHLHISIRAPLCGVRHCRPGRSLMTASNFNPRTPMWGATMTHMTMTAL